MCKIIKIKYVSPSGRRRTTERQELCFRSDGTNPCVYQEVSEVTELVSSGTPSLVGDDVPTPASASIPSTPLTATAHYTYREPRDIGQPSSSKSKGNKKYGLYLNLGSRSRTSSSPTSPKLRHRSERGSKSGSSNGDVDSIIGIEEDGRFSPISPSRSPRFSFGPALSMRRPREPPVVSQPQPPSLRSPTPAPPSSHRRNLTAPDATVRFDSSADTELRDRADAREALRRENRDRARREDDERRTQEADDRKLAEELDAKERREKAADEFSMQEYRRLQEKDRKRRERNASVTIEQDSPTSAEEMSKLEQEIRQMKIDQERRKRAREEAAIRENAAQAEKRIRDQEAKIEFRLQEDLARINRRREASNTAQLMQVQAEIDRLEAELLKQQEKRQARERAEKLQQEVKHEDLLEEEIRELEEDIEREEHLQRIERYLNDRRTQEYDRQRSLPPIAPAPSSQQITRPRGPSSPYEDADYRRAIGEQVLQDERARAATSGLQRAITGPDVGRRNTVSGRDKTREQVYRDLRKHYPG